MSTQSRSPQSSAGTQQTPPAEFKVEDQAQAAVIRGTVEFIGDQSDAMRWIGTPVRALNYATPISLLHDPQGHDAVLSVLGRIEHGIL